MTREDVAALLDGTTPGPWTVCEYDCGDRSWYDQNGPCPSIQAPDDQDCAIVHWDGFKQKYWSACDGNQKQIEANARMIAAAPDVFREVLRLHDELARVREALAAAFWDVCGFANAFKDEDFIGTVPSINGEIVGFIRKYYDIRMKEFDEVIKKIQTAYGSMPPHPAPGGQP